MPNLGILSDESIQNFSGGSQNVHEFGDHSHDKSEAKHDDSNEQAKFKSDVNECPPVLGLVDDVGILTLPPEDYDEDPGVNTNKDTDNTYAINEKFSRLASYCHEIVNRKNSSTFNSRKKRKKRLLAVNLTNCKYESVRRVVRRFGFREVDENEEWNLYWTDFSVSLDRVFVMKSWQKINHFPGMSEICRKDSLARNLNRMLKLFPTEYAIFPKTWCLPSEWNELMNFMRKRKTKTLILKPDCGCQGKGITITRSIKDIRPMENTICQIYLTKPFLIDGYKFDMRIYILITSCDPLRIYMFKDGLVRFTTVPYAEPNTRNVNNMYMHLTNYAVQKHSEGFVRDDEEGGTKRRITTLNRWFVQNGYDLKKIWDDIDDVVIKTVLSGYAVIRHNYRTCFPNHTQGSACFEILGFDIMFNSKLKPYVLEVNHSPSFTTDSRLDKEIKESMLWDTLQLVNCGMMNKKKCLEEERKRIRTRLTGMKKEQRDAWDKDMAKTLEHIEQYEKTHTGNFRLVFPNPGMEKYEQFINPNATFYQETMTYKVRSECARQLRENIQMQRERKSLSVNKNHPESPLPKKSLSRPRTNHVPVRKPLYHKRCASTLPTSKSTIDQAQTPSVGDRESVSSCIFESPLTKEAPPINPSWVPFPILQSEELARLEGLRRREALMIHIGLVEAVHRMLLNSPGVTPSPANPRHAAKPTQTGCDNRKYIEHPKSFAIGNEDINSDSRNSMTDLQRIRQENNPNMFLIGSGIRPMSRTPTQQTISLVHGYFSGSSGHPKPAARKFESQSNPQTKTNNNDREKIVSRVQRGQSMVLNALDPAWLPKVEQQQREKSKQIGWELYNKAQSDLVLGPCFGLVRGAKPLDLSMATRAFGVNNNAYVPRRATKRILCGHNATHESFGFRGNSQTAIPWHKRAVSARRTHATLMGT